MSQNNGSQSTSKTELYEKLRDLSMEKQKVKDQIRETEKQIARIQSNTSQ